MSLSQSRRITLCQRDDGSIDGLDSRGMPVAEKMQYNPGQTEFSLSCATSIGQVLFEFNSLLPYLLLRHEKDGNLYCDPSVNEPWRQYEAQQLLPIICRDSYIVRHPGLQRAGAHSNGNTFPCSPAPYPCSPA